jgi:hypothetical protein
MVTVDWAGAVTVHVPICCQDAVSPPSSPVCSHVCCDPTNAGKKLIATLTVTELPDCCTDDAAKFTWHWLFCKMVEDPKTPVEGHWSPLLSARPTVRLPGQ